LKRFEKALTNLVVFRNRNKEAEKEDKQCQFLLQEPKKKLK